MSEHKQFSQHVGAWLRGFGIALIALTALLGIAVFLFSPPRSTSLPLRCRNNLKLISLSFRTWSIDNGYRYPFNVPTNEGGSLEFCSNAPDGFDANAYRHLMLMSNELSTPRMLVCPADRRTRKAADFQHLKPENISYKLHSGTNVTDENGQAVLMVCPVDGNVLYCDGSVTEGEGHSPAPSAWSNVLYHFEQGDAPDLVIPLTIGFLLFGFTVFRLGTGLKLGNRPSPGWYLLLSLLAGLLIVAGVSGAVSVPRWLQPRSARPPPSNPKTLNRLISTELSNTPPAQPVPSLQLRLTNSR
jgi:prepilin-type processing-associated H-X9-DG protein